MGADVVDIGEDAVDDLIGDAPGQLVKIIRYPVRESTPDDQGVGPHKDSGLVTVLLQDALGGLQVEAEDGWIDVPPLPDTYVVNIGELLELASNGYLRATVHRVVTPPGRSDRLSVAFFLGARLDATVTVLDLPDELARDSHDVTHDPLNPLFHEVVVLTPWQSLATLRLTLWDAERQRLIGFRDIATSASPSPTSRAASPSG